MAHVDDGRLVREAEVGEGKWEAEGETGAQFTRRCTDLALKLHWENSEKPKELAHV